MTEEIARQLPLISVAIAVLMVISQLLDIKAKLAKETAMLAKLRTALFVRHWRMTLAMALGLAAMLSIAWVPVTQSSVLTCVLGGVLTAVAMAGILVFEISLLAADKISALLLQAQATSGALGKDAGR
ncbi:hypothetical protein [Rhodoferax aquaticus]|uniref:DUF2721 domain-containing protein n=1 Tax=Rhodoferax aquaticus TaxID=2527691 RepID=A0A515ERT5_9BURK|nr:hypothetical protein [Rhodoferax aquaticus]QDL55323.1 hypothetical protein EXZ61_14730 [Rhodoferax aquaticus]